MMRIKASYIFSNAKTPIVNIAAKAKIFTTFFVSTLIFKVIVAVYLNQDCKEISKN